MNSHNFFEVIGDVPSLFSTRTGRWTAFEMVFMLPILRTKPIDLCILCLFCSILLCIVLINKVLNTGTKTILFFHILYQTGTQLGQENEQILNSFTCFPSCKQSSYISAYHVHYAVFHIFKLIKVLNNGTVLHTIFLCIVSYWYQLYAPKLTAFKKIEKSLISTNMFV